LYGLDKIEIDKTTSVVLAEGTAAADALQARGWAAVGTITGALTAPSEHALVPLVDSKEVVLWPDNDDAGVHHMHQIATRLVSMGFTSLRVVRWGGAPRKADAADFDGTDEELKQLIANAAPWKQGSPIRSRGIVAVTPPRAPLQLSLGKSERPPGPALRSAPMPAPARAAARLAELIRPLRDAKHLTPEQRVLLRSVADAVGRAAGDDAHRREKEAIK
jgi:DNA primase